MLDMIASSGTKLTLGAIVKRLKPRATGTV